MHLPLLNIDQTHQESYQRSVDIWSAEHSLFEFVRQAWHVIESVPFQTNHHIEDICAHLEAVYYGQIRRLIINVHPRSTKTTIFNVMFPVWVWLRSPQEQFLCVSVSEDLSFKGALDSRSIIKSDWFQSRWGHRFKLKKEQSSKSRYANDKNGYRVSTTLGSNNMGKGGSYVLIDDPNNPFESDVETTNVANIWSGSLRNRVNDPRTSRIILCQQRTGPKDLTAYITKKEPGSFVRLSLPAEYNPANPCKTIVLPGNAIKPAAPTPWQDRRTKDKELLWPERFSKLELNQIKTSIGSRIFEAQYNQNPTDEEGGILRRAYWKKWKAFYAPRLTEIVQSWDTALTANEMSDFSACVTLGVFETEIPNLPGEAPDIVKSIIVLSVWAGRVNGPELLRRARRLYRNYMDIGEEPLEEKSKRTIDYLVIEAQVNGHTLAQQMIEMGMPAIDFKPREEGDKVARANKAAPFLECGLIYAATKSPKYEDFRDDAELLISKCEQFPMGDKDIVDAFTQAILFMKKRGILEHLENISFIKDKLDDRQLPGTRKEGEDFFKQVDMWKAEAEEEGKRQQQDKFEYIYRNKDQTYQDFKDRYSSGNLGEFRKDKKK